jgi:hypothetical protein
VGKILVLFDGNYADEFDIEGFTIMDEGEFYKGTSLLKHWPEIPEDKKASYQKGKTVYKEMEVYFGTNEAMIFYGPEDFKNCVKEKRISENEIEALKETLNIDSSYGFGDIVDSVFENLADYVEHPEEHNCFNRTY